MVEPRIQYARPRRGGPIASPHLRIEGKGGKNPGAQGWLGHANVSTTRLYDRRNHLS